jgi:UDP-N-acetylmuramoylalanine--D-glutamate ligase
MTVNKGTETGSNRQADPYTLVVGLGASGLAAARYLAKLGEPVVVIDSRAEPPGLDALKHDVPGARIEAGSLNPKWLDRATRIVLSPGLPIDLPLVTAARERGIDVVGELELFARAVDRPVIAVTGSNGKSTVTSCVSALLEAQAIRAPAGGNLGPPALDLLEDDFADVYVVEVSSFQLETTTSLAPISAALLNISPDHIDRHGSIEHYAALKASLLLNVGHAVVNRDDPLVRKLAVRDALTIPFSVREPLTFGWSVVEQSGDRWLAQDLEPLIRSAELGLPGETGEANSLAALALAVSYGADRAAAVAALPAFRGLPHRLQLVRELGGVRYIDDSKGTNVGATVAALTGDRAPTILIAGGQAKGADFAPLAEAAAGRVRAAILIGEAAGRLEDALAGRTRTIVSVDLPAAVATAASLAEPGDRVLLSPACASQDMFVDYRERGRVFTAAVEALEE